MAYKDFMSRLARNLFFMFKLLILPSKSTEFLMCRILIVPKRGINILIKDITDLLGADQIPDIVGGRGIPCLWVFLKIIYNGLWGDSKLRKTSMGLLL